MKKFTLMALYAILFMAVGLVAQPTTVPAAPPHAQGDVVSILSNTYTPLAANFTPGVAPAPVALNFFPDWSQGTTFAEFPVTGNPVKRYNALDYQGINFGGNVNASSMTTLHWDVFTDVATTLRISLISNGTGEKFVERTTTVGWNRYDIPLTEYTSQSGFSVSSIFQFKFEEFPMAYRAGTKTVYLYNLYFWKPANVPTLTGFTIPAKLVGDAPFALTAPTSLSSGAFTYTSSDPLVATVSGNMVTVVGAGTTTITANQAAASPYSAGTTSAVLTVSSPGPATAAPTPTRPNTGITSLYSNAYTDLAGTGWNRYNGGTAYAEVMIAGNATQKYTNLSYSVSEPAAIINATTKTHLHLDVWTATAGTNFKVKLVDFGANGVYQGTPNDDTEHEITVSPNPGGGAWASYDIPLSDFTGLAARASLAQFIISSATAGQNFWVDNIYFYTNAVTPVELTYFKAKTANSTSILTWQTASELDNQGFTIERSTDATTYAAIGNVKGNGTTSAVQNYTFTDNTPSNGVNYYRLRQTDFNGKETVSKVASVIFGKNTLALSNTLVHNTLEVVVSEAEKTPLSIFNVAGQLVFSATVKGTQVLDLSNLTAGVYIVRTATGEAKRFVKD